MYSLIIPIPYGILTLNFVPLKWPPLEGKEEANARRLNNLQAELGQAN